MNLLNFYAKLRGLLALVMLTLVSGSASASSILKEIEETAITAPTSGSYYVIKGAAQNGNSVYLYDSGSDLLGTTTDPTLNSNANMNYVWKITGNDTDGWVLRNMSTGNYLNINGTSNGGDVTVSTTSQVVSKAVSGDYVGFYNSSNQYIDVGWSGETPATWNDELSGSRRLTIYEATIEGDYGVTCNASANGSVSASPNSDLVGWETVTLTPTPNVGYNLSTLTVKDESNNTIETTKQADGTYTFTMPAGNVTVDATFAIQVLTAVGSTGITSDFDGYYVIKGAAQNGSSVYLYDSGSDFLGTTTAPTLNSTANLNYVWKITGDDANGWAFQNLATGNYLYIEGTSNNGSVTVSSSSQTVNIAVSGSNVGLYNSSNQYIDVGYGGTTPITWSGDVSGSRTLTIYEATIEDGYKVTCNTSFKGTVSATPNSGLSGTETITLSNSANDGFTFKSYTVKDVNGNAISVTDNTFTMTGTSAVVTGLFECQTIQPSSNTWAIKAGDVYVDMANSSSGTISFSSTAYPVTFTAGDNKGEWTIQSAVGGGYFAPSGSWNTRLQTDPYTWTMVDGSEDNKDFTIQRADGKYVGINEDASYAVNTPIYCDKDYTHLSPASLTLVQMYEITPGTCENGSVGVDGYVWAVPGATVTLTNTPKTGYVFGTYTVTDADGNPVTVTDGTFTMPAKGVTITATFTPKSVYVTSATKTMRVGKTGTPFYLGTGYTAGVTYSSDDESVATIDADGVVTAVSAGNTTLHANPTDATGYYTEVATIKLIVVEESSNIPYTYSKTFDSSDELYLYNKGTGLYLNIGGVWGTEGLLKNFGTPCYVTKSATDGQDLENTILYSTKGSKEWGYVTSALIFDASKLGLYCDYNDNYSSTHTFTFKYNDDDDSYSITPDGMTAGLAITYTEDGTTYYLRPKIGDISTLIWRTQKYYWSYDGTHAYVSNGGGTNYYLYNTTKTVDDETINVLGIQTGSGDEIAIDANNVITFKNSEDISYYLVGGDENLATATDEPTVPATCETYEDTDNFYLTQTGGTGERQNIVTMLQYSEDDIPNIARWFVVTREDLIASFEEASSTATATQPQPATFYINDPDFARTSSHGAAWTISDDNNDWAKGYTRFGNALYRTSGPTDTTNSGTCVIEDSDDGAVSSTSTNYSRNGGGYVVTEGQDEDVSGFPAGTTADYHSLYGGYYNCRMLGDNRSIKQTLTNLVPGWYKLSMNGYVYNPTDCSAVATLYAKASTNTTGTTGNDYSTATLADIDTDGDGTDDYLDMSQAGILLYNGGKLSDTYGRSVMVYVGEGATLEVGVTLASGKTVTDSSVGSANTFAEFDGLTLEYTGNQKDPIIFDEKHAYESNWTLTEGGSTTEYHTDYINAQVMAGASRTLVFKRKMVANQWNTLILPVNVNATSVKTAFGTGVLVSELSTTPLEENKIVFTKVDLSNGESTAIKAGKCYLVKPSSISSADTEGTYSTTIIPNSETTTGDKTNRTFSVIATETSPIFIFNNIALTEAITTVPDQEEIGRPSMDDESRVAVGDKLYLTGTYYAQTNYIPQYSYVISANKIEGYVDAGSWVRYTGTNKLSVGGFRSWIGAKIESSTPSGANQIAFIIKDADGEEEEVTAIDGINVEVPTAANTDNRIYSVSGQIVGEAGKTKNLPKGVYISNGKKYIIK